MNDNINYKVDLNNDDLDLVEYIDFNQCLNNPVATMTFDMQNKYGKNITELFRAFGKSNDFDANYEGFGVAFFFNFLSTYFKNNKESSYYTIDRTKTKCIKRLDDGSSLPEIEFRYMITDMDWKDTTTTITELNNNIAKNIAYCFNHIDATSDTNLCFLKNNFYYIATDNTVSIYRCNNTCCNDLRITYSPTFFNADPANPDFSSDDIFIVNQSFVVDITNSGENNMTVVYYSKVTGIQEIPIHFPPPGGPLSAYTIEQYKLILDGIIVIMTEQFKQLFPDFFKDLKAIAYTIIKDNKLYVSIVNGLANPLWLEGNGVSITPVYTNTNLSLTNEEIQVQWNFFPMNILTIKNY